MKFTTLLRRLGIARLARRAGVSPATIRRWAAHGPSARGLETLAAIAARLRKGKKQQKAREKRAAFKESLPAPASPLLIPGRPRHGRFDDPSVLVPDRPPVETLRKLRRDAKREGFKLDGSVDFLHMAGDSAWVSIRQALVQADMMFVGDAIAEIWQASDRKFVQVRFLLYRYIPWNPLYTGEMVKKQGKWHPFFVMTNVAANMLDLSGKFLTHPFDKAFLSAQSRLIWLEGMTVMTMDNKPDEPDKKPPRNWRERKLK